MRLRRQEAAGRLRAEPRGNGSGGRVGAGGAKEGPDRAGSCRRESPVPESRAPKGREGGCLPGAAGKREGRTRAPLSSTGGGGTGSVQGSAARSRAGSGGRGAVPARPLAAPRKTADAQIALPSAGPSRRRSAHGRGSSERSAM